MDVRSKQIITFIISFSSIFLLSCSGEHRDKKYSEPRNIPVQLCDGDIAFRRGMGVVSHAVISTNNRGHYSHVGVVLKDSVGRWCVVHEVPYEGEKHSDDKIYSQPIEEFYASDKACSGAIYRSDIDSIERAAICKYLLSQLQKETPFDHDYDLSDDSKLYCSELVWLSFLEAGIDLSQGRRTIVNMPPFNGTHIMPTDIELNDSLRLIYEFKE